MLTSLLVSELEGIDDGKRDRLATTPRPPNSALSPPRGRRGVSHAYCLILTNKGLTALQSRCTPITATDPISAKTPGSSKGLASEQPPHSSLVSPCHELPPGSSERLKVWPPISRLTRGLAVRFTTSSRASHSGQPLRTTGPSNALIPLPMVWLLPVSSSHNRLASPSLKLSQQVGFSQSRAPTTGWLLRTANNRASPHAQSFKESPPQRPGPPKRLRTSREL